MDSSQQNGDGGAALLSAIRENKVVQMETVGRKYKEESILDSTTAEARWRVNHCRLMGNRRRLTQLGGGGQPRLKKNQAPLPL